MEKPPGKNGGWSRLSSPVSLLKLQRKLDCLDKVSMWFTDNDGNSDIEVFLSQFPWLETIGNNRSCHLRAASTRADRSPRDMHLGATHLESMRGQPPKKIPRRNLLSFRAACFELHARSEQT